MPKEDTQFQPGESGNPEGLPEIWTEKKLLEVGKKLIEWLNESPSNIYFKEFCVENGLYRKILNRYTAKYPAFEEYMEMAKEIQEMKIIKWSMVSKLNTTMSIFILKNNHGFADKIEQKVDHTGDMEYRHHHHRLFDDD